LIGGINSKFPQSSLTQNNSAINIREQDGYSKCSEAQRLAGLVLNKLRELFLLIRADTILQNRHPFSFRKRGEKGGVYRG
jgi:hypothetical protein